jgi:hypothetical protein
VLDHLDGLFAGELGGWIAWLGEGRRQAEAAGLMRRRAAV